LDTPSYIYCLRANWKSKSVFTPFVDMLKANDTDMECYIFKHVCHIWHEQCTMCRSLCY